MIFIRYESFRQYIRWYKATSLILLINILMFLETVIRGPGQSFFFKNGVLIHAAPYTADWWRYVLSMFLHADFIHLLFNCFAIFVFAPPLERLLGIWRYAFLHLGSGIVGNVVSVLLHDPGVLSVGASGAIYGLYGAYLYLIVFRSGALDQASRKTVQLFLLLGILYTFLNLGRINVYAHLGGLAGGFIIFSGIVERMRQRR